jgi:hypothetical protein
MKGIVYRGPSVSSVRGKSRVLLSRKKDFLVRTRVALIRRDGGSGEIAGWLNKLTERREEDEETRSVEEHCHCGYAVPPLPDVLIDL